MGVERDRCGNVIPLSAPMMAIIMMTVQVLARSDKQTQDDKAFTPAISFCHGKIGSFR